MQFPRPLVDSYGANLAVAIFAISPFIVLTTAAGLYRPQIIADLASSPTALAVISGLATAGYAFGALLGGDLAQRFPQRPLFILCESLFALGCLLSAVAGGEVTYGAGRVLAGFATGVLLIVALPPVIQRFPPGRMPFTAAFVNIGFFGAVTAGPLVGGAVAYGEAWRLFYGGIALVGAVTLLVALFTLPDRDPPNPDLPFDRTAMVLAFVATALPFWATGELAGHHFSAWVFIIPLAVGMTAFAALLLVEYHKQEPLSPVKAMWRAHPLIGTVAAMVGGGAYITFLALAQRYQLEVVGRSALATGLAFWPQVVGVVIAAALLGVLFRTRFLPILTLSGMVLLMAGGALLLMLPREGGHATVLVASALLGVGAGATVSPGLFMAGMSLPAKMVGRTFAIVELVRSEADFILSPVMLQVAQHGSGGGELSLEGIRVAVWGTLALTALATLGGVVLYLASAGRHLPRIDLEAWLGGRGSAFEASPFGEAVRRRRRKRLRPSEL